MPEWMKDAENAMDGEAAQQVSFTTTPPDFTTRFPKTDDYRTHLAQPKAPVTIRWKTPWLTPVCLFLLSLSPSLPVGTFLPSSTFVLLLIALKAIDQFAGKEGLPAGMDPEVNNLVNDEVNKF
jgi:hypothetical protein